jgi:hypothetical protein
LGLWIFWSRFIKRVQRRKTSLLQNVIGMSQLQKADNTFNQFLYETWLFSFGKSWVFFLATLLLTSSQDWKRNLGITISSGASVWFAFRKEFLPWTHYFNLFSNMLYVSAKWATSNTNFGTKTIKVRSLFWSPNGYSTINLTRAMIFNRIILVPILIWMRHLPDTTRKQIRILIRTTFSVWASLKIPQQLNNDASLLKHIVDRPLICQEHS